MLDSTDNSDVFFRTKADVVTEKLLATYIPQSRNGSVVITTRDQDIAVRLVGRRQDTIAIRPIVKNKVLTLLEKRLGCPSDKDARADLIKALDCVPLAIS